MCKSNIAMVHVCMGFKEIVIMKTFIQILFTFILPSYKQKSKSTKYGHGIIIC